MLGSGGSPLAMAVLGAVMVVTYVAIGTGRLHKLTAALAGALSCVALGLALGVLPSYGIVHELLQRDLGVLGVLVGTSVLVDIAGKSGLFQFLAIRIAKLAGGDPRALFAAIVGLTLVFVAFLTIAPGTLIVVSLALVLCRTLELDPKPYLFGIALAANSGALFTFASGICTLMIGTAAGIPYLQFLMVSAPLALATGAIAFFVVRRVMRQELAGGALNAEQRRARLAEFDEWAVVSDRAVFRRCAWILGGTIVGFAVARLVGVGLDYVALAGGTAALLFSGFDAEEAVKKVNWTVILFFVALFVMIGVVEESGLLGAFASRLSDWSGGSTHLALVLLVPFVAVTSGVMDNIPVAATMIPVVKGLIASGLPAEPLWWGLVFSANLGGNGTPIGSIAGVLALHALAETTGKKVGWGEFLKLGGLVLLLQLVLTMGYLHVMTTIGGFPDLPRTP